MSQISVSIIVPCYNYGIYLSECLQSVLSQSFSDWECIIVDNLSTDNTKEITNQFIKKDSRFRYLYCETKGVSAARNLGIQNSNGKYILPLDADDKIAETYVQKALIILERDANIKLVYCEVCFFGERKNKWELPSFSINQMLFENIIFSSSFYRRTDFDLTEGYDEKMEVGYEDWDFWLTLLKRDEDVYKIPEILFFYRIRSASRNNILDEERKRYLRKQIFDKHKVLYFSNLNFSDIIFENYIFKSKYNSIYFKMGKWLLSPLLFIKRIFENINFNK